MLTWKKSMSIVWSIMAGRLWIGEIDNENYASESKIHLAAEMSTKRLELICERGGRHKGHRRDALESRFVKYGVWRLILR